MSTEHAEVVIIGGGVMGTSIAFHLAAAGITDILLLESHVLGEGSSGKPLGGVRAQFSTEANVLLGARSLSAFHRFEDEVGGSINLHRVGYLFVLRTPQDVATFEASIAMQNRLGVPSRLLSPAQAQELNQYLDLNGVLAAAYSPEDGYAHPGSVVHGYARAAAGLGVQIRTHSPVVSMDSEGSRVEAIHTANSTIEAGTVICAAGAWSGSVGAMAGIDLPVQPLRRQIALSPPLSPEPAIIPFTIDFSTTFYLHNAGAGLLLGWADPGQAPGFETTYDEYWLTSLRSFAAQCVPSLAGIPLDRGWAGLYEQTPDANALIGRSRDVENFFYATGFSGHGFLQAPAVGEVIRDLYLGREPFLDIACFDAARFGTGAASTELNIV